MTWRNPSGCCLENGRPRRAPGDVIRSTEVVIRSTEISEEKRRVKENSDCGQRWLVVKAVYQPWSGELLQR